MSGSRKTLVYLVITVALAFVTLPSTAKAATVTWSGLGTTLLCGAGNQSNVSCQYNWVGDSAPGSNDLARFNSTSVLPATIDANWNVGGIEITSTYSGTITQASGFTITVGSLHFSQAAGTFTGGNSAIDVNGNLSITGGTFTNTSGSLTISGNYSKTGGTFTSGSTAVTFDGPGTQTLTSGGTDTGSDFQHITKSNSGALQLATNALDVDGTLTISSSTTFDLNALNITAATLVNNGTLQLQGGETVTITTMDTDSGLVTYVGTGTYTQLAAGDTYYNLTLNGSGGSFTMDAALDVNGSLTITAGTLATGNNNITLAGNWSNSGTFTSGSNTVTLDGGSDQTVTTGGTGTSQDFNNLTINKTGTASLATNAIDIDGTFTVTSGTYAPGSLDTTMGTLTVSGGTFTGSSGALDVNGTLTLSSGTLTAPSGTFTVSGDWNNSGGAFTEGTGTVTFDGSSGQALTGETFYNLTVNNSAASPSDTVDVDSSAAITVSNTLTVTDGQLSPTSGSDFAGVNISSNGILKPDSSASITVSGNFSNSGTFTANSGTVTFDGTSQTIAGSTTFYNFTKTEGANNSTDETLTFTAGTTQTISNTWTLDGRDANDMINLVSSSPGTVWSVNPQGTRTLDYIEVTDSTNTNGTIIACSNNCTDISGNTFWQFDFTAPTLSSFTSSTSNGTYGPASTITITATYTEALLSGSTITVTLNNGASVALSTISGATVSGTYTVGATGSSQDTSDLTVSTISSESILDALSNTRTNSAIPSAPNNLGDTSAIVIDTTAPSAPTPSVNGGSFTSSQSISLTSSGGTIYYTVNGTTPTTSSTLYTSAITISATTTLKTINVDSANNISSVLTETYTITGTGSESTEESNNNSSTTTSSQGLAGPLYSKDGSDNAPIALEGTIQMNINGKLQQVIRAVSNQLFRFSVRPIDADQLRSLRLRVKGNVFNLTPYKNTLVYTSPVRLIGVLGTGIHNYALTADYGTTTRTEHGVIAVRENLVPYVNDLFQKTYGRSISTSEKKYWASRATDGTKKTKGELLAAMRWHKGHNRNH